VVVGAYLDDVGANSNQGSAYVFVRPPGGWTNMTQTAKLTASDGHRSDLFGFSVAMSGDTVVVGAFLAPGDGDQRGAAYVFVKPNPGAWTDMTQTAKLTTPGGTAPPFLGRAVAISGDTVVVGASGGAGAAYIFVKPGAGWTDMTATAQLPLPVQTGDIGGLQNHYLAISGDTVVAGTPFSDVNVGLATVFVKPGGGWGTAPATSATLAASDRTPGDFFGWSVAISGDTVVVGSSQDDVAPGFDHGSAYIFIKPGGGWTGALTESAKLTASVPTPSANFGWSVAIGGATVVVGARGHGEGPGAAYVFDGAAPDARAGAVQSVFEGALVTLDGSASVGSCLNFAWEQLAGPPADLAGDDTATPTFSAPLLPGGFESQTLTFRLTVSNDGGSSSDTVDVTVANVNHAPQAVATGPTEVNEGSVVELSGSASFDPDADPITAYAWEQIGGPTVALTGADTATPSFTAPLLAGGVGSAVALTFQLTVSDGALSDTDTLTVLVEQVNHAPIARAGADQTVAPGVVFTLDGRASEDSDGDPLQFHWVQVGGPAVSLSSASTATPTFTAPAVAAPTALTFRLTVDDAALVSAPDEVVITVVRSNDPPQCDLAQASPRLLWPPNHKMLPVGITGVADPNNDAVSISITGVTQDEPVNGLGDGDTSPDAVLQAHNVLIRAERSGTGTGRVYRISFTAGDGNGGSCAGAVTVTVPHSMKPGSVAIDDGQIYVSTLP
jgi:hypothetical protein